MQQQINLYQPVFRKQHKVFGAATLVQILGAALVLLLMIFGHARWTLASMQASLGNLQQQHEHMRNEITTLEAALASPDVDPLDADIKQLEARIAQRKSLIEQFQLLTLKHRGGFSLPFKVLAEQHVSGLWLDGVTLDEEGRIEVRGTALDEKLVPRYLQQLQKQSALANTTFETVSMTRGDTGKPQIQFVLRNHKDTAKWR